MNDPELDEPIANAANETEDKLRSERSRSRRPPVGRQCSSTMKPMNASYDSESNLPPVGTLQKEFQLDEDEDDMNKRLDGFSQAKRWWFTSTAFPLIAGTFGPLANLFSVCALVQTWRVTFDPAAGGVAIHGERVSDPPWLLAVNAVSLGSALIANILLLLNFARRVPYRIAQPLTIVLWYIASALLIGLVVASSATLRLKPEKSNAFSQSYYYGIISAVIYIVISTLLLWNLLGAYWFKQYPPAFTNLTMPQRTLMLQTVSFSLYLSLGAGVFASIEGWDFNDGIYWATYTCLTVGLGTDYPLLTNLGKALLIPYAVMGITILGLVVASVRSLVLERGKLKMGRRALQKERKKWKEHIDKPLSEDASWKKKEFDVMRQVEVRAEKLRRWYGLVAALIAFFCVWLFGALVFMYTEKVQQWTYFESLYFTYVTLLTIGYGDYYPQSNSGKPFFVAWALLAVPTVTVVISAMGDTVVAGIKNATLWLGRITILPEREHRPRIMSHVPIPKPYALRGEFQHLKEVVKEKARPSGVDKRSRKDVGKEKVPCAEETEKKNTKNQEKAAENVDNIQSALSSSSAEAHNTTLAARIAHEVRALAKNTSAQPPRRYEWDEWVRWLELLAEVELRMRRWYVKTHPGEMEGITDPDEVEKRLEWSWLGDGGPLLSGMCETEWILGRLCWRLEQLLEIMAWQKKEEEETRRREEREQWKRGRGVVFE